MNANHASRHDWLVWAATTASIVVAMVFVVHPVGVDDFWMSLASGRWIAEHREIPYHDPFSWTTLPQQLWVDYEWLFQIMVFGVFHLAGLPGTILFFAVIIAITILILGAVCRCLLPASLVPLTLLGALILIGTRMGGFRADYFTFLFAACTFWSLELTRLGNPRSLWLLPPLFWVWAQIHGGFMLGLVLLGAYVVGDYCQKRLGPPDHASSLFRDPKRRRELLAVILAAVVIIFANPFGWHLPWHITEIMRPSYSRAFTAEWQPLYRTDMSGFSVSRLVFFGTLGMGLLGFGLNRQRLNWSHLLVWIGIFIMSFRSLRFSGLVGLFCVPLTVVQWSQWWSARSSVRTDRPDRLSRWLPIGACSLAGVMLALMFCGHGDWVGAPQSRIGWGMDPLVTPVAAVEYLRGQPKPQRLFNSNESGNYLMWALPDQKIFIDPRDVVYGDQRCIEYVTACSGTTSWERCFNRWDFDVVVLSSWNQKIAPLMSLLAHSPLWTLVYFDPAACVFVRQEQAGRWRKGGLTEFGDPAKVAAFASFLEEKYPETRPSLADALHHLGAEPAAAQVYHADLARAPNDVVAMHGLATIAADHREWDTALQWIDRERRINPDSTDAYWLRAYVFSETHRIPEALADIGKVTRREPHNLKANLFEYALAERTGDLDLAISALRRAIKYHPLPSPLGYTRLGALWERKGETEQAIAAYEEAIILWPTDGTLPPGDADKIQAHLETLRHH